MSTLAAVRSAMVATLTAAGVRATTDPRDVNPPCVVVGLAAGQRVTGCAYEGDVTVSVVAPGAGHGDATAWLDVTASTVAALLKARSWSADTYTLPGAPGPLLAYTLTCPAAWEAAAP